MCLRECSLSTGWGGSENFRDNTRKNFRPTPFRARKIFDPPPGMVKKISDPPYLSVIKSYDPSFLRMGLQQGLNSYSPLFFNMRNVVGHMHAGYVCCQLYLGITIFFRIEFSKMARSAEKF